MAPALATGEENLREFPVITHKQIVNLDIPELDFARDQWTKVGRTKVDSLASRFEKNPNLALVLDDTKFRGEALVLVRHRIFERVLNLLDDLESGQAGLRFDAEEVKVHLMLLERLISEKQPNEPGPIALALKALTMSWSRITSRLCVFSSARPQEPRALTEEEERQLLADDEDDSRREEED